MQDYDYDYVEMMQEIVDLIQDVQDRFYDDVVNEELDFKINDLKARANRLKVDFEDYLFGR